MPLFFAHIFGTSCVAWSFATSHTPILHAASHSAISSLCLPPYCWAPFRQATSLVTPPAASPSILQLSSPAPSPVFLNAGVLLPMLPPLVRWIEPFPSLAACQTMDTQEHRTQNSGVTRSCVHLPACDFLPICFLFFAYPSLSPSLPKPIARAVGPDPLHPSKCVTTAGLPVPSLLCPSCRRGRFQVAGPLWGAALHDPAMLDACMAYLGAHPGQFHTERRLGGILAAMRQVRKAHGYSVVSNCFVSRFLS